MTNKKRNAARSLEAAVAIGSGASGVSVGLLCNVEAYLRTKHNGRDVAIDAATLNEWIRMLGTIDRQYAAAVERHQTARKALTQATEVQG